MKNGIDADSVMTMILIILMMTMSIALTLGSVASSVG
jgi:hypothetical protein